MKYFLIFLAFTFIGCDNSNIEPDFQKGLTIEGYIEEGKHAKVYLTSSLPFSGVVDSLDVIKAMETKAKVELISDDLSEILTLKRDDNRYPFLYYKGNLIKGEIDENYEIKISLHGQDYVASTKVPSLPVINYIETINVELEGEVEKFLKLSIENEMLKESYYKILIRGVDESKFSDSKPYIINNESVNTKELITTIRYNKKIDGEYENQLIEGEVFEIKLIAITNDEYLFIKSTKGDEKTNISIPKFSEDIYTNLSNGAFGFWSGENSIQIKVVIE